MPTDSTVADLNDLIEASAAVRKPFEPQVFLNICMFAGDQWVAWDGNQIYEPALEPWRAKVVDNRIQPAIRTEIAKMTKTRPKWVATPKSQNDADVSAARYAEYVMDDAWKKQQLQRKLRRSLQWARVGTAGYWKLWWDKTVGKKVDVLVYADGHEQAGRVARVPGTGEPMPVDLLEQMAPELAEQLRPTQIAKGNICVDTKTFFEIYPDPLANEDGLESCEYLGEKSVYSQDFCARHFPEEFDRLNFDASPNAGVGRARMAMTRFAGQGRVTQAQAKGIELCEYWSKDKHAIWSPNADVVLLEEANPYPWIPYVMFGGTPVPGQFYHDCITTQMVPRQISLNVSQSQLEENAERVGNPPFLRPSSMDDEDFRWDGAIGEEIVFTDTGSQTAMPSFMAVPELPGYVQNLPAAIQQSMMEITGQHEVSGAQVPAGVTAASAISMLQEADDTRLGPDIAEMEDSLSRAGQMYLWMAGKYFTDERHLAIAGEDGMWDVVAFKGTLLRGHTEIEAQVGSGLPQSKAAKQAAIQQLATMFVQNGVAIDERSWRRILGEFEIGGLEQFFASQQRDFRQVQEENRRLALLGAQRLEINSFDNDAVHIAEHEDFQKTSRYQLLPEQNRQIIEQHVADHRTRVAMTQQAPPLPQQEAPAEPTPAAPPSPNGSSPTTAVPFPQP